MRVVVAPAGPEGGECDAEQRSNPDRACDEEQAAANETDGE